VHRVDRRADERAATAGPNSDEACLYDVPGTEQPHESAGSPPNRPAREPLQPLLGDAQQEQSPSQTHRGHRQPRTVGASPRDALTT
jgi:hypothetical protein